MGKNGEKYIILLGIIILFLLSFQGLVGEVKGIILRDVDESLVKEEMEWRAERDKQMRSSTSWLSIAGLFWLEKGENSFGADASNKIKLISDSAPPFAGKFIFKGERIKVVAQRGVVLKVKGKEIKQMVLQDDDEGEPDIVELDNLRMWVIKRGEQYAIRVRDLKAVAYKDYKGLEFFPPLKKFKIIATFIPFPTPETFTIATIIGTEAEMKSPGYVIFKIDGNKFRLDAFSADPQNKKLFFIFKDETNGNETYGMGRFMVSDFLDSGKVDLNFNRAYNPPCAYTPYATCPLTPEQNWLKIRIEAGEKKYKGEHH